MSAAHASWRQRQRRKDLVYGLGLLAALAGIALLALWAQGMSHDLRSALEDRDALAQQVERMGGTPVAGPSGSPGEPGVSVTGPAGEPGSAGATGAVGPSGAPGASGRPGSPGAAGASGSPGSPGAAGAPGADSTVPGPQGPQGVPGADSTVPGPRGEKGDTGATGPAGASCEPGYSWQTPSYDPDARVCRRDGAPDPPESPSPSLAAGLDPSRRLYV